MNELNELIEAIKNIATMDDNTFDDNTLSAFVEGIKQQLSDEMIIQSVNQIIKNFEEQELTKAEVKDAVTTLCDTIKEMIYGEHVISGNKKKIIDSILDQVFGIFNLAANKYHTYAIELSMIVDTANGAKVPTYAHETDAAADLYAMEDVTLKEHSIGNKIHTGVKIQLPEGWLALIIPRSSIGAKTPLRLSNSVGLIDSGYRGELGVLYDNIGNEPYVINAGDRIAQLLVMPSYRFQAKVVDILADSDRGETGFGDSGK